MGSTNYKNKRSKSLTEEQKQRERDYQKRYRENMTEEQRQRIRDSQERYKKKYDRRTKAKKKRLSKAV